MGGNYYSTSFRCSVPSPGSVAYLQSLTSRKNLRQLSQQYTFLKLCEFNLINIDLLLY